MRGGLLPSSAFALLITLCGAASDAQAGTTHVHIQGFSFKPNPVTVNVGDTVTWDNHDGAIHTSTDTDCPSAGGPGPCEWDSGNLGQGGVFGHAFSVGGTFPYRCLVHGFMGTLVVVDPDARPDLTVSALTVSPNTVPTTRQVHATVTNEGTSGAPSSLIRFEYDYQGQARLIGSTSVPTVPVGASRTVAVTWSTPTQLGDFTVRAIADAGGMIAELDEANNARATTATVLLPPGTLAGIDAADPL